MQESSTEQAGAKVPPQNIEAEKSLLGAILLSDDSFSSALELVKANDFYDPRHAKIFASMTRLFEAQRKIDLITLTTELGNQKLLKEVGGRAYVSDLETFVPISSHAEDYAKLVAEASLRRRLISAGTEIANAAYEGGTEIDELVGKAEQNLFEVSDKTVRSDYSALADLLVDAYDRIEELHKNKGALRGLRTGFRDLDKKTAGLQKRDLIIIGARPAMGKTTLAENLAYNVATRNGDGRGVLFFSMEMSKEELIERMVSTESGVDNWRIRTGNLSDEDFARIGDAMAEMNEAPLYIDDTSSMTVLEVRNKARRAMHDHTISMVVIDYLQLIRGTDRYKGNRVQEVTEISRGLKTLARELEIPVIALAQLNRGVTDRDDPRPVLSDLRESGSIEQDADLVMLLHRPDYYRQNDDDYEPTNLTELIIAKHRHGEVGKINLYFHPKLLKFLSLDKEHTDPQQ